ncbi:MAG: hypothetical protein J6X26_04415 [Bacteroidales bacterium]|nr:hypothetical protein [Bacteroidales bacterium]
MKNYFVIFLSLIVLAFSSCKKDDDSVNYYKIGSEKHIIKTAAIYYESGEGYNLVFSDNAKAGLCSHYETSSYNLFEFDIPVEKVGEKLVVGEDDFDGYSWSFYMTGYDAKGGNDFGTSDYTDFQSGYFSANKKGNVWTITWSIVYDGVNYSGEYNGTPVECDDYVWTAD